MNKEIKIKLDKDNNILIYCNENILRIKNNTISALDIYELFQYENNDTYTIIREIEGNMKSIVDPIIVMFEQMVEEINAITAPNELLQAKLNEL